MIATRTTIGRRSGARRRHHGHPAPRYRRHRSRVGGGGLGDGVRDCPCYDALS